MKRAAPSLDPIFFGDIDPDNRRNDREYADALTCIRCGKPVRGGGFVIAIGNGGDFIFATGTTGDETAEYALGSECARRVPPTHRRAMDATSFDRMLARDRAWRAERDARRGRSTGAFEALLEGHGVRTDAERESS